MSLEDARKNLAKRLGDQHVVQTWFQLLDAGRSAAEVFKHDGRANVAVYSSSSLLAGVALFIEDMRKNGVSISCLIIDDTADDAGLCVKYDIRRISPDLLLKEQDIDFVVVIPLGKEFFELRPMLGRLTDTEIVDLWNINEIVHNRYYLHNYIVRLFKKSVVKMCALMWPYLIDFDNAALYRNFYNGDTSPAEYQKNPERFKELYCDIAEYSPEYIQEIFNELPIVFREGRAEHADCTGKYLNIINGRRLTVEQPDKANCGIYIYGGCTVFGYGTDDRYTMASSLQNYINRYYGSEEESPCSVCGLGAWGNVYPRSAWDFALNDEIEKKIFLYVNVGGYSYSQKKNPRTFAYIKSLWNEYGVDCIDLAPTLQEVEEQEGTYLDVEHVNHRGNRAIAKIMFDYLRPVLDTLKSNDTSASNAHVACMNLPLKWERLRDSEHSICEPLLSGGLKSVAIYAPDRANERVTALTEELTAQGIDVKYLIAATSDSAIFNAPCARSIPLSELERAEKTDLIITIPRKRAYDDEVRIALRHGKSEIISLDDLQSLTYDRYFYYPELLGRLSKYKVHVCILQWPDAESSGASFTKDCSVNFLSNFEYYAANLYDDITGFSQSYMEEITKPRRLASSVGEVKHLDCRGGCLNIIKGDRTTPEQSKTFGRSVFVFGDSVAFGVGSEERYTISGFLQEQLNNEHTQKPDIPICRVVNKGLCSPGASERYILDNKILPCLKSGAIRAEDVILWIQGKRYSTTERDKLAMSYLNETLKEYGASALDLTHAMQLAQKKGAYIDGRHVNHRGYRAAATKIYFDYLKGI